MMRWWAALSVAGLGAVVAIGGLLYGVLSVGVPYQDPTPAQAAAERMNLAISGWAVFAGLIAFSVGLLALFVLTFVRVVARLRDRSGRFGRNLMER